MAQVLQVPNFKILFENRDPVIEITQESIAKDASMPSMI